MNSPDPPASKVAVAENCRRKWDERKATGSRAGRGQEVSLMTRALSIDRLGTLRFWFLFAASLTMVLAAAAPALSANVAEEDVRDGAPPAEVGDFEARARVVVAPEPPHWSGWGDWRPGLHRSSPRIKLWVDRGEWSTYEPGDRMWVYFRVDRPCYVTILDYSPDGRVSVLYPSRWSGSSFVSPGHTYRIPESRRYSLRIAGPGGVETLVACAHDAPWPSGPGGMWIPRHRPTRGRVVVGRPGRSPLPGWPGRVVVSPGHWPVPPRWYDRPERWSCDSVSFYVSAWGGGDWWDGPAPHDYGYHPPYGEHPYGGYDGPHPGGPVLSQRFTMRDCSDRFSRDLYIEGDRAVLSIDCIESSNGGPTEIIGRVSLGDYREDDVVFRIDVEGEHGQRPYVGAEFEGRSGPLRLGIEIADLKFAKTKRWQIPRLDWIEFDLNVYYDR
jgi:hypothetical protein